MDSDLFVQINNQRITVNPYMITPRHSIKINEKMTEARINATMYSKVPPIDGEKKEDWIKRYNDEIKKQNEQLKDETAAEFIKRAVGDFGFKDNMEFMYSSLQAIAEVFEQSQKVSREGFENASIVTVNNFIANVCKKAKVPCPFNVEIDNMAGDY